MPAAKQYNIMGIDPGSRLCGFGIINSSGGYVASGTIVLPAGLPLELRLKELFDDLDSVIREHSPRFIAVEKVFFAKSVKSALTLGHARGVALLACAWHGVEASEYSALEVKKSVTGYGKAEKQQVEHMVRQILGIRTKLSPDSADALAIALCHMNSMKPGVRG